MTPLERAAMALWELHPLTEHGDPIPWDRVDAGIKDDLAEEARAVIAVIRAPSEAMTNAGLQALEYAMGSPEYDYIPRANDTAEIYTDMIDAMLAEGE